MHSSLPSATLARKFRNLVEHPYKSWKINDFNEPTQMATISPSADINVMLNLRSAQIVWCADDVDVV